jgi:hypothetical protein
MYFERLYMISVTILHSKTTFPIFEMSSIPFLGGRGGGVSRYDGIGSSVHVSMSGYVVQGIHHPRDPLSKGRNVRALLFRDELAALRLEHCCDVDTILVVVVFSSTVTFQK